MSSETKSDEELAALGAKEELVGMVVNVITSLGHDEKKLLDESYGDVSKAQIFGVGRKPANALFSLLVVVGGAAVGVAIIASFFRKKRREAQLATE